MKVRKKEGYLVSIMLAARNYMLFFLTMSFVITCCMLLFFNAMSESMGIELTQNDIGTAATLTILNILFLSFVCTLIDAIRRRFMVGRPVKRIVKAAEKVMCGDLSVRIEKRKRLNPNDGFNTIIDYFNQMTKELSCMETLRTDFIANVSHELKTPLAILQNYGTMLQQPNLSEETKLEYAKTITDTSRSLADMISNILKLNKLENQSIYPSVQTYHLSEQLCECLLGFENMWEAKNLEIQTQLQEDILVSADPELLSLVWNNLFSNAIKFTNPGGTVSLFLETEGGLAIVRVSDTGCGISAEVGKHIFEKFYQGDTSHATKGNGLGLALVKRVIDITNGDISVVSEVGKGSTFTVKLGRKADGAV